MSKINQIQTALLESDGGKFQKLADAYLFKKGYEGLTPLGAVSGADKARKGTPDTYFNLPNRKYILGEYTTQQTDIYKKFVNDLEKCFDVMKTGVPVEGIVFCHTSVLSPTEKNNLAAKCQMFGINLNIFGMGEISYDLFQKYPGLARDFLGVEVDTGQIMPPDEFVNVYNKNRLATRLDTAFYFRKKETEQVLQWLEESDLVVVSGRAGVGKSRFALECCKQFNDIHPDYKVLCIYNRGIDLHEDLRVYFSEPGHFLIFVDDANHTSRFDYIIQLLQGQREDQLIKVVVTVRDYTLAKVQESANSIGDVPVIKLQLFDDNQIKKLIEKEYGILNSLFLDRIAYIAKGNPRLAVMAAEVVEREDKFESILDITTLYDNYFAAIKHDLEDLGDRNLIRVAGIVAFFQALDRSNKEIMGAIEDAFEISSETFWEAARKLHDLEIIDMHENEVLKTSDQILSTYLFYLAFFKEKVLDFSVLLNHFFPKHRHRLVDAINPVLNAFDFDSIKEAMIPGVDRTWASTEAMDDKENLLHLIEVFWFLKPTNTLQYIKSQIDEMDVKQVDPSQLEFKGNSWIPEPSLLGVLRSFGYGPLADFRIALTLLFDYIAKRPNELPQVLYILTDKFGFKHTSYAQGFRVQKAVIDALWKFTDDGHDDLYSKIFVAVAEQYLHTSFHGVELKGHHTFSMINFQLPPTPELFGLRQTIWERMLQLYQISTLRESILDVLNSYCTSNYRDLIKDIVIQDATVVLPFIDSELEPTKYRNCLIVHQYLDLLEYNEVSFDLDLRDRFINEAYNLSRLLSSDLIEMRMLDLKSSKYRELKKKRIEEYFGSFEFDDYKHFIECCLEIKSESKQNDKRIQFKDEIVGVFLNLAEQNPNLYAKVMKHYVKLGEPLGFSSFHLIKKLISICGAERTYEIINQPSYPTKNALLFNFYISLSPNEVTDEHLRRLYVLFQEAQVMQVPYNLDFLLKYSIFDSKVIARVTEIILKKAKADPSHSYALSGLFNQYTDVNKAIIKLFEDDLDLLKQAYFAIQKREKWMDHDSGTLSRIIEFEPDFLLEYIDQIYEEKELQYSQDDAHDYAFLWRRDDFEELMIRVVERIFKHELEQRYLLGTYTNLETFFIQRENNEEDAEIIEKQNRFLKHLIEQKNRDPDFMQFIFAMIVQFPTERRHQFIAEFLERNKCFEAFKRLSLEPNSWGWSGSAVPMLQKRLEYFESLLLLLNEVQLLQHKQYVEGKVQEIRTQIELEKKKDFMDE